MRSVIVVADFVLVSPLSTMTGREPKLEAARVLGASSLPPSEV